MRISLPEPIKFSALLASEHQLSDPPTITGITIDSRKAASGDLFVAIKGARIDGHDKAAEAVRAGAVAVLAEGPLPDLPKSTTVINVKNTIFALGELAHAWRVMLDLPVIGITGSNGKTTTKNLVVDVLSKKFAVLGTDRSYNSTIGLPLTLLTTGSSNEVVVLEMGSNKPGEIERLAAIARPNYGLITNISEVHLAGLESAAGVTREKAQLFRAIDAAGTVFINLDDPAVAQMPSKGERITYSMVGAATFRGRYTETLRGGDLKVGGLVISLPQAGIHLAQNALAAVAVGKTFKIDNAAIQSAIESFAIPSGRGEIFSHDGVMVIDDSYNANLASTMAGLRTLAAIPVKGRRIAVLGDMLELGPVSESHHRQVGEFAAGKGIQQLLCYGPESLYTCAAAEQLGLANIHFEDKTELAKILVNMVHAGDAVYFKGSRGMAVETIIDSIFNG